MKFGLFWGELPCPTHVAQQRAEKVGNADCLEKSGNVEVVDLVSYGYKLVLPEHEIPDRTGWKRLLDMPLVVLEGAGRFRRFLAECEREHHRRALSLRRKPGFAIALTGGIPETPFMRRTAALE